MRSKRTALLALVAALAVTVPRVAGADAPPAPELPATTEAGLAQGRAVGRALVSFQSPDMCAIPLLVARCRSDFDAFVGGDETTFDHVPGLGANPLAHMRAYYASGDPAQWVPGFATIRTATAPDTLWAAHPAVAWAMDEGIVDETVDASIQTENAIYATPPASQLLRRVHDAGPESAVLGSDFATADGHFQATALARIARNIDQKHPVAAMPLIPFPQAFGDRGDVLLGIGFATVFQMCDDPGVLALPESQAFLDQFFAAATRYSSVPEGAKRLAADRDALRFTTGFDKAKLSATLADLIKYQNALPGATLRRTLIGQFVTQLGYNATVQRDPGFVSIVIRRVTQWNDADDAFPGLARRRVALGLLDQKDWLAQRKASMALLGFLSISAQSK